MAKSTLINLIVSLFLSGTLFAQELNCKVTIMHDKIAGVDPAVYTAMQKAVTEFMNSQKWTPDEYKTDEKIDVTLLLNLQSNNVGGDLDSYSGSLSIQASRPVYNASYTTTIVNYVDKAVQFKFTQFSPLHFDDNQITGTDPMTSNLTAILGYYAYLIIGLDNNSFAPEGGTNEFKKAQNVVNNAPESGSNISGWKAVEGNRNRYWLIDQILNTRFQDVRNIWYTLHREALDSFYTKPNESRLKILAGIKRLNQVNRDNPSSVLLQFFFNAKSDEYLHILAGCPKQERSQYITILDALDVPNAGKYNSLK